MSEEEEVGKDAIDDRSSKRGHVAVFPRSAVLDLPGETEPNRRTRLLALNLAIGFGSRIGDFATLSKTPIGISA
jgi:hypothetical protein